MRITRREEFEMAHILPGYNGPCGNLHGHSYKIEVTVEGPQDQPFGMVMDFKNLKEIIKSVVPDHRFVFNGTNTSNVERDLVEVLDKYGLKYVAYPFDTTAENMVVYFANLINEIIQKIPEYENSRVVEVNLWETTNSHATWKEDVNT